jgi:hypothetical protein
MLKAGNAVIAYVGNWGCCRVSVVAEDDGNWGCWNVGTLKTRNTETGESGNWRRRNWGQ